MASKSTINIPKLQGSQNFIIWHLRASAYLIKEGYGSFITDEASDIADKAKSEKALAEIQLLCEDGPLIQIQGYKTAFSAWEALKGLYNSKGFSSEYLLTKEFFDSTLDKYSSLEEYLNKVKELNTELKSRDLTLPKPIIIG